MTSRSRVWPLVVPLLVVQPLRAQNLCTGVLVPAVVLEVRDASSGASIAGMATATMRDGAFLDTLRSYAYSSMDGSILSLRGALERSGMYDITVSAPGYRTWQKRGVRVNHDECHAITVQLVARLKRST